MMKVNFLKRLESSVIRFGSRWTAPSPRLKTGGTITRSRSTPMRIRESTTTRSTPDQFEDPDFDEEDLRSAADATSISRHLKLHDWLKDPKDRAHSNFCYEKAQAVTPDRTANSQNSKSSSQRRFAEADHQPRGKPNRKVLVFTAFADTARYLYDTLSMGA